MELKKHMLRVFGDKFTREEFKALKDEKLDEYIEIAMQASSYIQCPLLPPIAAVPVADSRILEPSNYGGLFQQLDIKDKYDFNKLHMPNQCDKCLDIDNAYTSNWKPGYSCRPVTPYSKSIAKIESLPAEIKRVYFLKQNSEGLDESFGIFDLIDSNFVNNNDIELVICKEKYVKVYNTNFIKKAGLIKAWNNMISNSSKSFDSIL